jgi:subtilisin family serine protease
VGGIVALTLGADRWQHYNIVPMAIGDRGVCLSGMAGEDEYPYNRPGLNVVAALRDLATEAYRAVKVVNLSWGFDFTNPDLRDALLALMNSHGGKLVVLSAGNGDEHGRGIQMTSDREEARNLRALLTLALHPDAHQRLIIVGATEAYEWVPYGLDYLGGYTLPIRRPCQEQSLYRDTPEMIRAVTAPSQYAGESLALFSNYPGASHLAQSVFICAPGEGVMSTVPAQADGIGVAIKGGTSMAAPVVSGLLAKALMSFPYLTVDDVRNLLFQTAGGCFLKDGSLRDRYGSGMVNADAFRRAAEALNLEKTPQLAAFSIVPYITYLNQILR